MIMRKKAGQVIFVALAILVTAATHGYAAPSKIDPALVMMMQPGANLESTRAKGIVRSVAGIQGPVVKTILKFDGDLSGIEYYGGKVRSIIGNIATVDIPLSAISDIALLPNVSYIEAARLSRPRLDVSVPATKADLLRSGTAPDWTGYTGHNVVIGVVDTGIDLHHKDFKDTAGKTRILSLWDQNVTGTPPSGFSYGKECSSSSINAGSCTETDTVGHGTHVTGIAAGNGSATGNGQSAYRYIGMAPEADIIFVKTNFLTTGIIDGIAYIQARAAALGKPSVINLSLGSHYGPHDGTSLYEQGLDAASGTGKVIVGAAGNEATAAIHASGNVISAGSTTVNFNFVYGTDELLDVWTAGTNTLGIRVTNSANITCTASVAAPDNIVHDFPTSCGDIQILSASTNPNNGDREIQVSLANASGSWSFTLTGTNVPTSGRFDVWAAAENAIFTDHVDPTITLVDTSTASKTISVASYNTKDHWSSVDGHTYTYSSAITIGDISDFSSIGPRRSCTGGALTCPGIQKPEIAAPGMGIMSTYSANTSPAPASAWIDQDGKHIIDQGTSMATPHVTGAVALLLQKDPTQTSDQIKTALFTNTAADTFTGLNIRSSPTSTWGYGKLDAQAASLSVTAYATPPAPPTGLAAAAKATDSLTLTWTANSEPYLEGYNLYRSTTSGLYTTPVNTTLLPNTATSYKDTGLTTGTTYYYVLRAVNFAAQESADSNEASAKAKTIVAVGGGGGGGGCFIATAAYGSYLEPHVMTLRAFRDNVLLKSDYGRMFVNLYYAWSPPVANIISGSPFLRFMTRMALTPLVLVLEYPWLLLLLPLVVLLILRRNMARRPACS